MRKISNFTILKSALKATEYLYRLYIIYILYIISIILWTQTCHAYQWQMTKYIGYSLESYAN